MRARLGICCPLTPRRARSYTEKGTHSSGAVQSIKRGALGGAHLSVLFNATKNRNPSSMCQRTAPTLRRLALGDCGSGVTNPVSSSERLWVSSCWSSPAHAGFRRAGLEAHTPPSRSCVRRAPPVRISLAKPPGRVHDATNPVSSERQCRNESSELQRASTSPASHAKPPLPSPGSSLVTGALRGIAPLLGARSLGGAGLRHW